MSSFSQVKPFPEWRQLLAAIEPLRHSKTQYSYDDLKELCGADVRQERGRQQFYKFRKAALKQWHVWFENSPGFGYVLIPAAAQPKAAIKRVGSARRKVKMAQDINSGTSIEGLTPAQMLFHAQVGALVADLAHALNGASRKLSAAASKFSLELPEGALEALDAPPKKKAPGPKAKFTIEAQRKDEE